MSTAAIPEAIAQLKHHLDEFRSTRPRGRKLPESVWQAAVELARQHPRLEAMVTQGSRHSQTVSFQVKTDMEIPD